MDCFGGQAIVGRIRFVPCLSETRASHNKTYTSYFLSQWLRLIVTLLTSMY